MDAHPDQAPCGGPGMKCANCGSENAEGGRFCYNCGATLTPVPLGKAEDQQPQQPETPPSGAPPTPPDMPPDMPMDRTVVMQVRPGMFDPTPPGPAPVGPPPPTA